MDHPHFGQFLMKIPHFGQFLVKFPHFGQFLVKFPHFCIFLLKFLKFFNFYENFPILIKIFNFWKIFNFLKIFKFFEIFDFSSKFSYGSYYQKFSKIWKRFSRPFSNCLKTCFWGTFVSVFQIFCYFLPIFTLEGCVTQKVMPDSQNGV